MLQLQRLLLFVTDLEIGGTPTVVRELANHLPAEDLAVEVACLGRFGPTAEEIEREGGHVTAFDARVWQLPQVARRLRKLVEERGIDVVLSFLVHANVVAALAAGRTPQARWFQSIQTTQPYPKWHWTAQRWVAKRAARIIVPSQSIADAAVERSGVPASQVVVIPNAVDASDVVAHPRALRAASTPLRVGFLGRLDPIKNVPDLVKAVLPLEGVELHIFGDGPDRPRVEAAAAGSTQVTLHGFTDRQTALGQIDCLCLASSAEGMPMVLVEAMAAGVPVIGTNAPGIRDVIDHNRTGWLVGDVPHRPDLPPAESNRVHALSRYLAAARDQPDRLYAFASAALEEVRARYTWDRVLPQYRQVLLER